jgi:hypothetical protein
MPTKVNVELIIVWACVGFFTGAGWAVATWLVGRILGLTHLQTLSLRPLSVQLVTDMGRCPLYSHEQTSFRSSGMSLCANSGHCIHSPSLRMIE